LNALQRIPVGVVVERHKATSQWIDFIWRPAAVLYGEPVASPWTKLREEAEVASFYAGMADIELHRGETANYRDNLSTGEPVLWVVLRPTGVDPPYEIVRVTADPSEGEGFASMGDDIVEKVAMPEPIWDLIDAFIAEHHVDRPFYKRKRNRADPESLGRRRIVREDDE
jgi:hypothetical protein